MVVAFLQIKVEMNYLDIFFLKMIKNLLHELWSVEIFGILVWV